ncbi:MAG: Hsp33 family molecular chaperone HslO [Lachnospiraceae bacterium]|nr:Hsp33 family molecular chaperone HslO [Lachnospiraceae bacterium]
MADYIVRATAANAQIRAFACSTRETVEEARKRHDTTPVATAALGRLMSGALMMGVSMKGEKDVLTLQVQADGPLQGITATADSQGHVKGYVGNPDVNLPLNGKGKLDVSGAVGKGILNVIKDLGMKEPYNGQIELVSGEIGEDLTYYFAASEQIPSSVGLGVLIDRDYTVAQAGGFIVQLMPFASEEIVERLEQNVQRVTSVTALLSEGMTPEDLLRYVLEGFDIEFTDTVPASFFCDCSRQKTDKVLISVGRKELQSMIDEGEPVELKCHFCNTAYAYSTEELRTLFRKAR